jgi:2,4-dienoyl-CoA reductase-like NADH-dependent reductase (Old Yellow Enzyme family)
MVKLNGADFTEGGLTIEDAVYAAKLLDREGIDAIEISGGTPASGPQNPIRIKIKTADQEAYNLDLARQVKDAVKCPIMVVGGFRSVEVIEAALKESGMDYIALARPFIREPNLAKRWQNGDTDPAKCISCNGCFKPGLKGEGIYCVVQKKEEEESA